MKHSGNKALRQATSGHVYNVHGASGERRRRIRRAKATNSAGARWGEQGKLTSMKRWLSAPAGEGQARAGPIEYLKSKQGVNGGWQAGRQAS